MSDRGELVPARGRRASLLGRDLRRDLEATVARERTRARRAPLSSRTRCSSVRSSSSRTMTPEMVCDALTTESKSSCSAWSATVAVGPGGIFLDELRVPPLEVARLAFGAPAEIAVASLAQVRVGDEREPRSR